jgi:hypothetical protein
MHQVRKQFQDGRRPLQALPYRTTFSEERMKFRSLKILAAALTLLGVSVPTFAHHGIARFDTKKTVTVVGTVTEFRFANPHSIIFLNVKDNAGNIVQWQGELTSPNFLGRSGWSSHTLKSGDEVTLSGHPSKTGDKVAWVTKVILPGGRELESDAEY